MKRIVAAVLAVLLAANAVAMIAAPMWWYGAVPGVTGTGPYNHHFILDIGAAYLTVAGGLAWFAWRPASGWPALVAGTTFLALHGLIHIADAVVSPHCGQDLIRDFGGVYLPPIIMTWLALGRRPT